MKYTCSVPIVYLMLVPAVVIGSEQNHSIEANRSISDNWFNSAMAQIRLLEYEPSIQSLDYAGKPFSKPRYHITNRAHNLRAYFDENGVELMPRVRNDDDSWGLTFRVSSVYPMAQDNIMHAGDELDISESKIVHHHGNVIEEYSNSDNGIGQTISIIHPSRRSGKLLIRTNLENRGLSCTENGDDCVTFSHNEGNIIYQILSARDAVNKELISSAMYIEDDQLTISIDDEHATYPIRIDLLLSTNNIKPERNLGRYATDLSETPDWTAEVDQDSAYFGYSVSTAGDVNGDGYSDVIIGAPLYDAGQTYEGMTIVYHGSETGLSTTPDWYVDSDIAGAQLGYSVSAAGDVNGDGYSDVIIGAPYAANGQVDEGMAFVYHGSSSGLSWSADWSVESNQIFGTLGHSVSTAGDVNGDGFSDVIVGAPTYDEGRAFVYHGSGSGLSSVANWTGQASTYSAFGSSVSTAGDVNGDGCSDIIVGAPNYDGGQFWEGRALVYHGSAGGLSSTTNWTAEGDLDYARFGYSVSTAGDVNGDGYSDVIVGSPWYTNDQYEEGRAFAYIGSSSGLSSTPDWTAESDQASAHFGSSVSNAGDVNGDGYSDVMVGAPSYDDGQTDEGRAYVFRGWEGGLSGMPDWTAESDQASAIFGSSVATAGDVNGDGFCDVIIGAPWYDNGQLDEGMAFVYHGSVGSISHDPVWTAESDHSGAKFGWSVSTAGDVNGDGISDVIIGAPYYDNGQTDEGMAFAYHGSGSGLSLTPDWNAESDQAHALFGSSVATAGDVNGDGNSDVIVGVPRYHGGTVGEGRACVYHGNFGVGLSPYPDWYAESGSNEAHFGSSVATAGDVNGDGYSDVIIGAPGYDNEGWAFAYHGSAAGLSSSANWHGSSDQNLANYGSSVSTAGDVNGDGFSDVIVGAPFYNDRGRAYAYYGSGTGLPLAYNWISESDQIGATFGSSVSTAGDVNGDGYSDVIVGSPLYDNGQLNEGMAFVYHGYATGLSMGAQWWAESDDIFGDFGGSVSTAGDVNGDGFSDVLVGAPGYDEGNGQAYVYLGTDTLLQGLSPTPDWQTSPGDLDANFGFSVSTAGDVNGDGYSDVIIGAPNYDHNQSDEGWALVYYGNAGGTAIVPRQATVDRSNLVQLQNATGSSSVRLKALARTPGGQGKVKLQWEIKELDQPFNGTDLGISNDWYEVAVGGTEISEDITGLQNSTAYHWRARFKYSPTAGNGQVYSRWFSVGPNGMNEKDFITTSLIGLQEHETQQPLAYTLSVNPNPFSTMTKINLGIGQHAERIELKIYDVAGRFVKDLYHESSIMNRESVINWNGTDQLNRKLASGVYFVKLTVDDHSTTEKILLIR